MSSSRSLYRRLTNKITEIKPRFQQLISRCHPGAKPYPVVEAINGWKKNCIPAPPKNITNNKRFTKDLGASILSHHLAMLISVSVFVESVVIVFCDLIDGRISTPLFEHTIQPIELDLMLEARVVHLAVGLAALHQANQTFRLRAGQLRHI
jgi:hypothetical protein